jgi:hypothetical protein
VTRERKCVDGAEMDEERKDAWRAKNIYVAPKMTMNG